MRIPQNCDARRGELTMAHIDAAKSCPGEDAFRRMIAQRAATISGALPRLRSVRLRSSSTCARRRENRTKCAARRVFTRRDQCSTEIGDGVKETKSSSNRVGTKKHEEQHCSSSAEQVLHRLSRDVSRLGLGCQAQLRRIGTAPPLMTHVVMAPAKATAAKAAIASAVACSSGAAAGSTQAARVCTASRVHVMCRFDTAYNKSV